MKKKTIMLVCAAGMSTSMLVTKMKNAAQAEKIEVNIFAISANDVDFNIEKENIDVILLGPQVRFMKDQFERKVLNKEIVVDVINSQDYGMMNGKKVLHTALGMAK